MNQSASVSVLITSYNHERFVGRAVDSALKQTLPPEEVVVIDDCSTDNSVNVVREIADTRVRLMTQPYNLGGLTTVKGLLACHGAFVAILNSDDEWEPSKLEKQIAYMEAHPDCGVVFTRPMLIDDDGKPWGSRQQVLESAFNRANRSRTQWLRHCYAGGNAFCASSAVLRARCVDAVGPFDHRYIQLQDFEMWVRVLVSGYDVHVLNEPLTRYRVMRNSTNLSAPSEGARATYTYEYARLLRNYWNVASGADLKSIFPDAFTAGDASDRLIKFYLARIAGGYSSTHHRQFAADSMFEVARDHVAMTTAAEQYGFTHADYRSFMAGNPLGDVARGSWFMTVARRMQRVMPRAVGESIGRLFKGKAVDSE